MFAGSFVIEELLDDVQIEKVYFLYRVSLQC